MESPSEAPPVCVSSGINAHCDDLSTLRQRRSRVQIFTKPLAIGGNRATILALTTSALGAGIFTMPYGFSKTGVFSGLFILALCASISGLSLHILIESISFYKCDSYSALARRSISPLAGIFVDAIVTFNGIAVGAIFLADFIRDILMRLLGPNPSFSSFFFRPCVLLVIVILALPLSVRKSYGALRNVTLIYVLSIVLTITVVAVKAPFLFSSLISRGSDSTGGTVFYYLWHFEYDSCRAFNICLFAFMQHQNAVPIFKEMIERTQKRSVLVSVGASIVEFVLYGILGVSGYLSFLSTTQQNFINLYPETDLSILFCRILLSFCLMFAIPMSMISTGSSMRRLVKKLCKQPSSIARGNTNSNTDNENNTYNSNNHRSIDNSYQSMEGYSPSSDHSDVPRIQGFRTSYISQQISETGRRFASVVFILVFDLFMALRTDQVAFLVSFIGGCFSVTLMCGFPLLIYKNGVGKFHSSFRYLLTVSALLIFFVAGLGSCIVILIEKKKSN